MGGDSVCAGPCLVVSVDTGDVGAGPVAPPISVQTCTVVLSHGGGMICVAYPSSRGNK